MEPEEVAEAFDELHKSGKVRHFGVSNQNPMQVELLEESRHATIIDQPIAAQPDACADDRCRIQREYDEQSINRA